MLNRFKNYLSNLKNHADSSGKQPSCISQSVHGINKHHVSRNATRVIKELQAEGWQAYLVGGGVRDLLLGLEPKDFDVATNATPEQVQSLFRRARIIGRRFKIVHVRMGPEVLEVTTFRGSHQNPAATGNKQALQSDTGVLLRDNVYGNLESDAYRRDFTINALYYDPSTEDIVDYVGAMADLKSNCLRIIGNAEDRYKEDPVRMIRAIRFQCKLGLTLDKASHNAILKHANYLAEIPAARLFDEVLKLFLNGYAEVTLTKLQEYGLLHHLLPCAAQTLEQGSSQHRAMLIQATKNTDLRIATNKRVTPAFVYAAFLWPAVQREMLRLNTETRSSMQECLYNAAHGAIFEQQQRTSIPKRFQMPMRDIWLLQLRFEKRDPKRAQALLEHPRFRAAYDFLLLRESTGEQLNNIGEWWTRYQFANADEQTKMTSALKQPNKHKRRQPKRTSKKPAHQE